MSININTRRNGLIAAVATLILVVAIVLSLGASRAGATNTKDEPCTPQAAYTETVIVTPAVPEVPGTPAVPAVTETVHHEATPDLWWNWSPNKEQGPFEGPPAFPVDPRGTWQGPHENGGPEQGTYGTFQTGPPGNGNWFHREKGVDAYDEVIVITPEVPAVPGTPAVPAVTQTIEHAAVTCNTTTPTPTVTETPVVPEEPEVVTPEPEQNTPDGSGVQVICEDGQFVTYINGEQAGAAGSCDKDSAVAVTPEPATEEGL